MQDQQDNAAGQWSNQLMIGSTTKRMLCVDFLVIVAGGKKDKTTRRLCWQKDVMKREGDRGQKDFYGCEDNRQWTSIQH